MKWTLRIGMMVAVMTASIVAGVALATLSDTQTTSGTINATSISPDLYICEPGTMPGPDCGSDDSGADETVFESLEDIRPGGYASWDIRVKNIGTEAWQIFYVQPSDVEVADPGDDCPDVLEAVATRRLGKAGDEVNDNPTQGGNFPPESAFNEQAPNTGQPAAVWVEPGDYEDLRLRVTLNPTGVGGCDANEWNVTWTFEATTTAQ